MNIRYRARSGRGLLALVLLLGQALLAPQASAATAAEIDASVDAALDRFHKEVDGANALLAAAEGVLVLPGVIKAGIGIGGEYGEGALRIDGSTVDYYSIASASVGFQLGAQKKDVVLLFLDADALRHFRASSGWKAGVDGSVALVDAGAGGSVDTERIKDPIIGFVFGQKGLMYNLTLEGSKLTRVER